MKQITALLLAAVMLLSLTACGSSSEPEPTIPSTQPVIREREAPAEPPTEAPTEAPTEPTVVYTPYTLSEGETYMDAVQAMGY